MPRPGPQSYQKRSVRIRPTRPTTMRTTPTTSRSSPLGSSLTAQVRIAPDAIRIRLTAMPTFAVVPRAPCRRNLPDSLLGGLPRDEDQLAGHPRMAAPCRELFEPTHDEAGLGDDGDEIADRQSPPAARPEEVALTPVQQRVDARRNGMRLVQEQEAARSQRREHGTSRCGEVVEGRQRPLA